MDADNALTAAEITLPEAVAAHPALAIQCASFGKWHLSSGGPMVVANAPNTIGGWPHYAGATGGALANYTSWTKTANGTSATSTSPHGLQSAMDGMGRVQCTAHAISRAARWFAQLRGRTRHQSSEIPSRRRSHGYRNRAAPPVSLDPNQIFFTVEPPGGSQQPSEGRRVGDVPP